MTDTNIERLVELERQATAGPWAVSHFPNGQAHTIDCENAKIGGPAKLFDVRGWGYLTGSGHGALGLSPQEGAAIQRANAEFVTEIRNAFPEIVKRIQELEADNSPRKCAATNSTDPPQDCDWPHCGCDPAASKVVESLVECGWLTASEADDLCTKLRAAQDGVQAYVDAATAGLAEIKRLSARLRVALQQLKAMQRWQS